MSVLNVLKDYYTKKITDVRNWRHEKIIEGELKRMDIEKEKQAYNELEADYQAMKSREDRIRAILDEKWQAEIKFEDFAIKHPVKKWWELITPKNPKLVRVLSERNNFASTVLCRHIKADKDGWGFIVAEFGHYDCIALVTGHEYRAYTLDPKDWPNLDDTEGLE